LSLKFQNPCGWRSDGGPSRHHSNYGSATHGDRMYRSKNHQQAEFPDFYLPFSGHLDPENRWVTLARLVPWELAEAPF